MCKGGRFRHASGGGESFSTRGEEQLDCRSPRLGKLILYPMTDGDRVYSPHILFILR